MIGPLALEVEASHGFITVIPFSEEYGDQLIACARMMHDESVVHCEMDFSEEKVLKQARAVATNPDSYLRLAVLQGEVIGLFFGVALTVYFGSDRIAKDLAIYVKKKDRLSRAAFLLVRDFEPWARSVGASWAILSQTTGLNIETTTRFYKVLGYQVTGVTACKRLA